MRDTLPNSVLPAPQGPLVRCAAYARYSSEAQKKTSSEDQLRNNRAAADQKGWLVLDQFIRVDEGDDPAHDGWTRGVSRPYPACDATPKTIRLYSYR